MQLQPLSKVKMNKNCDQNVAKFKYLNISNIQSLLMCLWRELKYWWLSCILGGLSIPRSIVFVVFG